MKLNAKHILMSVFRASANLRELTTLIVVAGFMTSCGLITNTGSNKLAGQAEFMDDPKAASSSEFLSDDAIGTAPEDFNMDGVLDDLVSDVQWLKDQIEILKDADEELAKRVSKLETDLTAFITKMNEKIEALEAADAELRKDISALIKEDTDFKARLDVLESEKDELKKQVNDLWKEISRIDIKMEEFNSSLNSLETKLQNNEIADWAVAKETAQTILSGYAQEADTVGLSHEDAGIVATQTKLTGFIGVDNPDAVPQFQEILSDIAAVKIAVQTAVEQYKANLEGQILEYNTRLKTVESDLLTAQSDIETMKADIAALQGKMNLIYALEQRITNLETRATDLETAVASINADLTPEVLQQIKDNTSAIKTNKEFIDGLISRVDGIDAEIARIKEEILGLKIGDDEINVLKSVLDSYKEDTLNIYTKFVENKTKIDDVEVKVDDADIGVKIAWITEISVEYQATSIHYVKSIAELIQLFRVKEKQDDTIDKKIDDIEGDFTQFMNDPDLVRKEAIRKKMDLYAAELTKLEERLVIQENAGYALAKDVVTKDEYNAKIKELEDKDKELFDLIQSEIARVESETEAAITEFRDSITEKFNGLGDEIQGTVAGLAQEIADLNVKTKSLEEQLAVVEGRVDGLVVSEELKNELELNRTKAEAAYELFIRALFDLERHIPIVWDLKQGRENWVQFLIDFEQEVMMNWRANPAVCGIEPLASFPNSIGLDAQKILAMEYVNQVWKQAESDISGTLQRLAIETTMLDRYPAGEASAPECIAFAMAWAETAYFKVYYTSKDDNRKTLQEALDENEEYRALRDRFIYTLRTYAQDWQNYENTLAKIELENREFIEMLADIAVNLKEGLATKAELEALRRDLENHIESTQKSISSLQTKDGEQDADLLRIQQQVDGIDEAYLAADQALHLRIDQLPKPNVPQADEKLAELIALVAEIAKREGHSDLALEAEKIGTELFGDIFKNDKYTLQPHFTDCQHFFTNLYNDLENGELRDQDGNVVTEFNKDRWYNWTMRRMDPSNAFCKSNDLDLNAGAPELNWHSKNSACWINFRGETLRQYHNTAVGNVMYRCMGSAQLALGESNNGAKIMVPFTEADDLTFQAKNKIVGFDKAEVIPSDRIVVHGSMFSGVMDFFPTPLLLKPEDVSKNAYFDIDTYMTPVAYDIVGEQDLGGGITTYEYNFRLGEKIRHRVELYSPIVLDFISKSDKVRTLQHAEGVKFDLDANGNAEKTGWVDGLDGAFLALDLNKNGKIDDGSELFGQSTILENGKKAKHGYEALAHYDANKDGKIDSKDPIFKDLVVWFDKNVDGVSQKHELYSLSEKDVTALSVSYTELAGNSGFDKGNLVKYKAKFFGPSSCPETGCNSYDVFFGASVELSSK